MPGYAKLAAVFCLVWLLLPGTPSHAQPQTAKIALLIGNQGYDRSVGELRNPHNDIAVVGDALRKQGFRVLPPVKDARRSAILGAVRELVRQLNAAGAGAIGFLYYSGHGAAESDTGFNYLIPVDAKEPGSATFWDDSLKLDDILKLLDGARGAAKFIVFDACRNELRVPAKSTTKGLLPVAEQQGMFIAYASAPGRTASDAGTTSGPYAAALAVELGKGGQDHLNLFQNVKEAVIAKTGGVQQPWFMDGLVRRIYPTGVPQPISPAPSLPTGRSEAAAAWEGVRQTQSTAVLEAFAKQFSGTVYAAQAQERLSELRATPPSSRNDDGLAASPLSPFGDRPLEQLVDANFQKAAIWRLMKREFPDWYNGRVQDAVRLRSEGKDDTAIAEHLTRMLVDFRRRENAKALVASPARIKAIAATFVDALSALAKHNVTACYSFISSGEVSPVFVELMRSSQHVAVLQRLLNAMFEAVVDGKHSPRSYQTPNRSDYDILVPKLTAQGWTNEDMQTFSDAKALARAEPSKICQMVQDWFKAQLAVDDPDVQARLLADSIKPILAG